MDGSKLPIYSKYEDDPHLQDEISDFVIALAELVDSLQDAQSVSDYEQLEMLSGDLATQSSHLGYLELSEAAEQVSGACKDRDGEIAQECMMELTEVSRRIRLGHRGAA
jgi:hypothetical protein